MRFCKENRKKEFHKDKVQEKRLRIIILLGVVGVIAVWNSSAEARWDSAFIYKYIHGLNITSLFHMEYLSFCNHISMSYIAADLMAGVVFGNLKLGMTLLNIGLYLASVWCVYLTLRQYAKSGDGEAALFSAIYACSPFLMGLVNYNYWDYWVIVLLPIILYFAYCWVDCFGKQDAEIQYSCCINRDNADFKLQNGGSGYAAFV